MAHPLEGPWRSRKIFTDPTTKTADDLPDYYIVLVFDAAGKPDLGKCTHTADPLKLGTPIDVKIETAKEIYSLTILEPKDKPVIKYEGYLTTKSLSGALTLVIVGAYTNLLKAKKGAKGKGRPKAAGQEDGIWVATKP